MGGRKEFASRWGVGTAPSNETVEARTKLSPAEVRGMLDLVTAEHIGTMSICAGLAYLGVAVGQLWSASGNTAATLASVYGITGVALLAFALRTKNQPLPVRWSIHAAGVVFMTITGSVILAYALGHDPSTFFLFVLVQFAAGALLHSRSWLVATMAVGDLGWLLISASIGDINWGRSLGYLIGFSVVTLGMHVVRRRTLVELHELRAAAERASRAKTEFLANTSHEIRNTMSGIGGLGSLLLETELDPKQTKMASAIRDSTDSLVRVVDDILDFSKLQQGRLELEETPFDLGALTDGVAELMEPRAFAKGLELEVELAGLKQTRFVGDGNRLRQVLLNLVGNAVKFTEAGSVSIRAELVRPGQHPRVRLSVRDTGIGIPEEALGKVFARYQQQDETTSRRFGGTGLGLAISRQLADLMGGELGVESDVGSGTTFWLEVDLNAGPEDTLRVPGGDGASDMLIRQGLRVLLAEDNPTSAMVTEALLKKLTCEVDIAIDGRDALEMARIKEYDIIFMDLSMPMMDGFQAAKRIRSRSKNQEVPIVALTASTDEEERERCLTSGMNDTMGKPVRATMLQRMFGRWVSLENQDKPITERTSITTPGSALDMRMVRQLVSLDEDDDGFIQEVMVAYIDQLRESVDALGAALDASDMEAVHNAAHSIKGASKQIGASKVGELLGAIERENTVAPARALVDQVAAEIPRVEAAIHSLLRVTPPPQNPHHPKHLQTTPRKPKP